MNKNILHVVNIPFVIPYYFGDQILFFKKNKYNIYIATEKSDKLEEYVNRWNFKPFELNIKRSISPIHDIVSIYKLIKLINQINSLKIRHRRLIN